MRVSSDVSLAVVSAVELFVAELPSGVAGFTGGDIVTEPGGAAPEPVDPEGGGASVPGPPVLDAGGASPEASFAELAEAAGSSNARGSEV